MKICPYCSQLTGDDETECSWCLHKLTDDDIVWPSKQLHRIHDPISPRCKSCRGRSTKFIVNRYRDFPVHSIYQCQSCQKELEVNNYVLTIVYALWKLLKGLLSTPYGGS